MKIEVIFHIEVPDDWVDDNIYDLTSSKGVIYMLEDTGVIEDGEITTTGDKIINAKVLKEQQDQPDPGCCPGPNGK